MRKLGSLHRCSRKLESEYSWQLRFPELDELPGSWPNSFLNPVHSANGHPSRDKEGICQGIKIVSKIELWTLNLGRVRANVPLGPSELGKSAEYALREPKTLYSRSSPLYRLHFERANAAQFRRQLRLVTPGWRQNEKNQRIQFCLN